MASARQRISVTVFSLFSIHSRLHGEMTSGEHLFLRYASMLTTEIRQVYSPRTFDCGYLKAARFNDGRTQPRDLRDLMRFADPSHGDAD